MKESEKVRKALDKIFTERKDFILIGVTGRTGSGCSQVAEILSKSSFKDLELAKPDSNNFKDNDARREYVVYNYMEKNWQTFEIIQVRNIITSFILDNEFYKFEEYIENKQYVINKEKFKEIQSKYDSNKTKAMRFKDMLDKKIKAEEEIDDIDKIYKFYLEELNDFTEELRKSLNYNANNTFTAIYQDVANNIRASGQALDKDFNPNNIFSLAKRINAIIKVIHSRNKKMNKSTAIVIDAIRNPYEAMYFKDRYSAFYLFSINCSRKDRIDRLIKKNLTSEQINNIDSIEYPTSKLKGENIFSHQDIQRCTELADVYLYNENSYLDNLKKELLKYVSLIMHPGLINPTRIERCMQIAYNAKVNSGCISRQVGAVVTDNNFNIKSVGWNDVPKGQVPCNLKSINNLCPVKDSRSFSKYELEDECFRKRIEEITNIIEKESTDLNGRTTSYCFKDIYNSIKGDKNQVHTRSLHAEENAFLQVSKYGGVGLQGGNLFTTASPCELCAKKAYQIGIEKIYYIDLYPGISEDHILNNGDIRPELVLFNGAIGRAYIQFYTPILPYKDEIYSILDIDIKNMDKENSSMSIFWCKLNK